jgi:hypothetical protein
MKRTIPWLVGIALACGAVVLVAVVALVASYARPGPKRYDAPDRAQFDAFLAEPGHQASYDSFVAYLDKQGVADVVEPWHLWRQGTDWRTVDEPPFAIPPRDQWSGIVPTLTVVRDEVVPLTGPVEVMSGFRTEVYNSKAGGAKGSRHKWFEAVDMVPVQVWRRSALHGVLVPWWKAHGKRGAVGLGLYDGVRFHVDTHRYRNW